jgi:hypothetical protein
VKAIIAAAFVLAWAATDSTTHRRSLRDGLAYGQFPAGEFLMGCVEQGQPTSRWTNCRGLAGVSVTGAIRDRPWAGASRQCNSKKASDASKFQ